MTADNPGAFGTRLDIDPHDFHCDRCWCNFHIGDRLAFATMYFNGQLQLPCIECGNRLDWWECTLKSLHKTERTTIQELCLPIGARSSIVTTALRHNVISHVTFTDAGIPDDAFILNINYNTQYPGPDVPTGTMQAVEIYRNPFVRRLDLSGARFYGIPHGQPPYPDAELLINVTWAPSKANDISWDYLVNAFRYYIDDRYHGALIAANGAVETLLARFMKDRLQGKASKDHIEQFLKDAASYGNQLNVLLPAFLAHTEAPPMPDYIRGSLNRLKNLRNDLAHANSPIPSITEKDAATALCAAVFGIHYLNVIQPFLFQ